MLVLTILALSLSITPLPSLLKNTSGLSETYQQKCLNSLPHLEDSRSALESLLCGEKVTDAPLRDHLSQTSLIHIFVVSGSHLLWIDEVLSILRIPFFVRWIFLGGYTLLVGWQAPAARALAGISLRRLSLFCRLHFPGDLVVLITGLLCLVLYPDWWRSMSFQMSWCASLGMVLPSSLGLLKARLWRRALLSQLCIYGVMIPTLWGWGTLHPVGILINLFITPLIGFALLPLAVAAWVSSWGESLFVWSFDIFNRLLPYLSEPVALPQGQALPTAAIWIWIFCLHLGAHFMRIQLFRQRERE